MGFILLLLQIIFTILRILYLSFGRQIYKRFSELVGGFNTCAFVAWLVMGSVFRWRDEGQLCSEDLIPKAGKFMQVYLILMFVLVPLFICCLATAVCL